MWKNVIVNYIVLSFIVFSGEYLHYRLDLQKVPEKNTLSKVEPVRYSISGVSHRTSHPAVISGVPQILNTFHISGSKITDSESTAKVLPADKATPNNLIP